jgi:hypothetical protein
LRFCLHEIRKPLQVDFILSGKDVLGVIVPTPAAPVAVNALVCAFVAQHAATVASIIVIKIFFMQRFIGENFKTPASRLLNRLIHKQRCHMNKCLTGKQAAAVTLLTIALLLHYKYQICL